MKPTSLLGISKLAMSGRRFRILSDSEDEEGPEKVTERRKEKTDSGESHFPPNMVYSAYLKRCE